MSEQLEVFWGGEWTPCEFVADHKGQKVYALDFGESTGYYELNDFNFFRAKPTERERWIQVAVKKGAPRESAERLYDAGFANMPEDES